MSFLYVLIALIFIFGSWLLEGGIFAALIQVPALFISVIAPFFFAIAATSGRSFGLSWKLFLSNQVQADPKEVERACSFLKVFGYTGLLQGAIGSVMGIIATLASAGGDPTELIHHIGAAIIAMFWGMVLRVLCYVAEQRIRNRYPSSM